MTKVICYIDGFNLCHAIDDLKKPYLKWVDLWALAESLCRHSETLCAVKYFSAYATWLPDSYHRHREFVSALLSSGVDCYLARFNEKTVRCKGCNREWKAREEKETDVHFRITFIEDAMTDAFDRAIIISADGDYIPAIRRVRARTPAKQIFVAVPPGRHSRAREITSVANSSIEITSGRVARCLFARQIANANGATVATRPLQYDPPPGWAPPS